MNLSTVLALTVVIFGFVAFFVKLFRLIAYLSARRWTLALKSFAVMVWLILYVMKAVELGVKFGDWNQLIRRLYSGFWRGGVSVP